MIKFAREVKRVIRTLEEKGFEAYAVGGCVRDSLLGIKPLDWDIATSAKLEDLVVIFPEAKVISEKFSVIRMDILDESKEEIEGIVIDVATFRTDGEYSDKRRPDNVEFINDILEDLKRRDFSMNSIADNGAKFLDPYNGAKDISDRIINTIKNPDYSFKEDPVRMLRAVRFASELNFDLTKEVYQAICDNWKLVSEVGTDRIRQEFMDIMAGDFAGKGLKMLIDTGMINVILGEELVSRFSRREMRDILTLCDNIHKTKPVVSRRLGLLYTTLSKKKAIEAISKMNYGKKINRHLMDAATDMPKLYFITNKNDLKKFIYKHGWERYTYLANLEKAQRLAFDYDSRIKIEGRMHWVNEMKNNGEPIFIEDLKIDGNDLIEAGICKGEEIGKMLTMLVETTHLKPMLNNRIQLLNLAKKYKKNKLAAITRSVKWLR